MSFVTKLKVALFMKPFLLNSFNVINEYCVIHPYNPTIVGVLCKHKRTGIYTIIFNNTLQSCPQDWASKIAAQQKMQEVEQ